MLVAELRVPSPERVETGSPGLATPKYTMIVGIAVTSGPLKMAWHPVSDHGDVTLMPGLLQPKSWDGPQVV